MPREAAQAAGVVRCAPSRGQGWARVTPQSTGSSACLSLRGTPSGVTTWRDAAGEKHSPRTRQAEWRRGPGAWGAWARVRPGHLLGDGPWPAPPVGEVQPGARCHGAARPLSGGGPQVCVGGSALNRVLTWPSFRAIALPRRSVSQKDKCASAGCPEASRRRGAWREGPGTGPMGSQAQSPVTGLREETAAGPEALRGGGGPPARLRPLLVKWRRDLSCLKSHREDSFREGRCVPKRGKMVVGSGSGEGGSSGGCGQRP